ncbi:MAG: hypothetical protein ACI8T1_004535 [Verrucomicrobiales bacterium]|jgi:hypothetical protein
MKSWKQQRRWRVLITMITAGMALAVCEGVVRFVYESEDEGDSGFLFFDSETFAH